MKRKTLAIGLIPVFVAWVGCATVLARTATYVVDRAAPVAADTNTGAEDKPFKTIRRAAEVVNPGDAVMAGRYDEQVKLRISGMEDKTELFHMYDHTVGNADRNYTGGYRDNAFKHFIRKIGALDAAKADAMEILWQIRPNYNEPDTARLAWDANTTYHFREEWEPDGTGKSLLRVYRDGKLLLTTSVPGSWKPAGHSVSLGAGPRRDPAAEAPVGAVFSNVKVWDFASRTNVVRLNGKSFCDDTGPFLGLGVSYFQALRHAKVDRERLNRNLALFAAKGFNYVRVLSMVSWDGLEIAPVTFTNRAGRVIAAWPDYWQQFRDLLDLVAQHGLRAEVTIFADAQYVMPSKATRKAHLDGILANIAGHEPQLLHLEVANEAWQNGFPGGQGIADLREFTRNLADRTSVLVAITSNDDTSDPGIIALYRDSAADLATVHFSRDARAPEGGWLPVRDSYRVGNLLDVPPVSSNEPIGPGSSVSSESDPIKLCAAAVFAYIANLPAYVYHSRAGVYGYTRCCPPTGGEDRFEDSSGMSAYQHLRRLLPPDLASWTRNDGLEPSAPFTVFCDGQPNRYWTEVRGATNGCHRNIGSAKGGQFVCLPMGILAGGVTIEARRPLQFEVLNPLAGVVLSNLTMNAGQRFTLPQGPDAYILKGTTMIFPGKDWRQTSPESQGIDPTKLRAAMDYLALSLTDHGGAGTVFMARNGHAIWQGPDCDREFQIFSATKSFTSTMLGLLIDDGKVTLDTFAKKFEPALAEQYSRVTLRHFATMTSGYDSVGGNYEFDAQGRGDSWNPGSPAPPIFPCGTKFRYWDDAMSQFGNVLTKAAGQPLDQLFLARIAEPIGMTRWRWTSNDTPTGRVLCWTGGIRTSARELARFGHLFLNRGHWNGQQLLSASWVDQATAVQVPPTLPNDVLPRSRGAGVYGFNWWVNGIKPNGQRLWPGTPPRTFYANGLHNNVCIVVPEWRLVITRTNGGRKDGSANTPANVDEIWSGFFNRLADAMTP